MVAVELSVPILILSVLLSGFEITGNLGRGRKGRVPRGPMRADFSSCWTSSPTRSTLSPDVSSRKGAEMQRERGEEKHNQ